MDYQKFASINSNFEFLISGLDAYRSKKDKMNFLKCFTGGLSKPSKMPGHGYGLPARHCKTGSKLSTVEGSICSSCYGKKGHYMWPMANNALENRYDKLQNALNNEINHWREAMTLSIYLTGEKYFRWHDNGDIQSEKHLQWIVDIANWLPEVKFWIPTHEKGMAIKYIKRNGKFPDNLCVRISGDFVNGYKELIYIEKYGMNISLVYDKGEFDNVSEGFKCMVSRYSNKKNCGRCRRCWDKKTNAIIYKKH